MGKLSRIRNCPRVVLEMECPNCGFFSPHAKYEAPPGLFHKDPYLEIGPVDKPEETFRVSLLQIAGADK